MGSLCTKNNHIEPDNINLPIPIPIPQLKIKNILLVDDIKATEILFKSFIDIYIDNPNINFKYVSSGEAAIKLIQQGNNYDIIFMDIIMGQPPQLDGYQTTQKIRDMGFSNLILGLTGMVDDISKAKGIKAGINDFCAKPIKWDDLIDLVKSKNYLWH